MLNPILNGIYFVPHRLFCRLASLLRAKFSAFGSDVKITVKCLEVLIKAFDARSIVKSCPEFIRTSMLTFFNNSAEDLGHTIANLQEGKYSHLRGTHLKTSTSLNYIHTVVLPVLTALFDHLASYEYGSDLICKYCSPHVYRVAILVLKKLTEFCKLTVNDLQLAAYKMLNSLYQLGTDMTLPKNRKYMKLEIERHRPAVGSCLGAFASTFPIAFLEPTLNKNNPYSCHHKLQAGSGACGNNPSYCIIYFDGCHNKDLFSIDVMSRLGGNLPTLNAILTEVEQFVDSGKTYNEVPHIIDITLPMLCSYLPFWWAQGPDNVNITTTTTE